MIQTLLQTPTPNLEASISFYTRLGFHPVAHPERTFFADGNCLIEINADRFARSGVVLYREDWAEKVEKLKEKTIVVPNELGFQVCDPSGVWVYLRNGSNDVEIAEPKASQLGTMAGLTLETIDMGVSVAFWKNLGFEITMGAVEQGWVVVQNEEKFGISFMKPNTCPHLFFNPSLTYFNSGNNLPVIEAIRKAGIPITEEITVFNKEGIVDNVIIRDPGGLGFFVFND